MPQGWDSAPSRRSTKALADGRGRKQHRFVLDAAGIAEQPGVQEPAFVLRTAGSSGETEQKDGKRCGQEF